MKISNVTFKGLFNRLDYNLHFHGDEINILTGPNGYGKTIILKSINAIINADLDFFEQVDFNEFSIDFNNVSISIHKSVNLYIQVSSIYGYENIIYERNLELDTSKYKESISDMEIKWSEMKGVSESRKKAEFTLLKHMDDLSVLFIRDQRIKVGAGASNEIMLTKLASDLRGKMRSCILQSNSIGQRLDASFPRRLLELEYNVNVSMIEEKLNGLKKIRKEYIDYGLLDDIDNLNINLGEFNYVTRRNNSNVLELYINDSLEKYKPFWDLTKKIKLFISLLNRKGLAFKYVSVNKEFGFAFFDNDNDLIVLDKLSSGEQNQIIMLYNLIFLTNEDTIVLVDEPEISLHIAWQKEVYQNLEEILKINEIPHIVMATHSPSVINGNWDKSIDLYELANQNGVF